MTFNFSKVFHVRSVTQGDVIRAEAKDIPRIFQVCISVFPFNMLIVLSYTLGTFQCKIDFNCLNFP